MTMDVKRTMVTEGQNLTTVNFSLNQVKNYKTVVLYTSFTKDSNVACLSHFEQSQQKKLSFP